MEDSNKLSIYSVIFIISITLLYWYWEAIAEGDIRIDLLVIYPAIFVSYLVSLWKKYGYYSILISTNMMLINIVYFILSYDLVL